MKGDASAGEAAPTGLARFFPVLSGAVGSSRFRRGSRVGAAPAPEPLGTLVLSVSDAGWRGTLLRPDRPPEDLGDPQAGLLDSRASAIEVLQRAVRSITPAQRADVGSVRLLVSDPVVQVVDNRYARLRSTDAARLNAAGAQLLGSTGAVGGFQPFGQSSEGETLRGIYAFVPSERVADWLGALDSLATKLVQLVPADALFLADGAGALPVRASPPAAAPFVTVEMRADLVTLLLADPLSGTVAVRRLGTGVLDFAAALAEATGIAPAEALSGLERRNCIPDARPPAEAGRAQAASATERALTPLLASLRDELRETLEYFLYQRLAHPPEALVAAGECARIRGLDAWLGAALELPLRAPPDLHGAFLEAGTSAVLNLLDGVPKGLLRIGGVDYEYKAGRFAADPAQLKRSRAGRVTGFLQRSRDPLRAGAGKGAAASKPLADRVEEAKATLSRVFASDVKQLLPVAAAAVARAGAVLRERPRRLAKPVPAVPDPAAEPSNWVGSALAGCALLCLGAGVAAWVAASAEASAARAQESLAAALAEDAALRTSLRRLADMPKPDASADALFWTDKLLLVAQAMPQAARLTRAAVSEEAIPGQVRERLVLEGVVRGPRAGHARDGDGEPIRAVTELVARLQGDAAFMRGVASVSLDGTASEPRGDVGADVGADRGAASRGARDAMRFTLGVVLQPRAQRPPGARQ